MRIALILDPRLPPDRLAALGALAERNGIEGIWTSSLLGCRDPFVSFVPLAQATRLIRLGPIAVNPFDTHPTRIAASLLTLNELSAGRAQIVLGGGGEALASLGIRPERRVRAVREAVAMLREAAAGKVFDYAGQIYRVTRFDTRWATATPPTIWVGANGPQMLAMAAAAADGIMVSDLPEPLLSQAIASASDARRTQAPDAPPLQFSNFVAWHVYDDRAAAEAEARRWVAYRGISRRWVCTTFMSDREFDLIEAHLQEFYRMAHGGAAVTAVPDSVQGRLIEKLTITGTRDHLDPILAHLDELRRAGLSQVALRLYQEPEQSIELIGRHVVPAMA